MSLIGELILGVLLELEAETFRSRKGLLIYAVCRNLVGLVLIALFATMVWWNLYKGGLVLYLFALVCGGLLVFQLVSLYSWNRQAIKHFRNLNSVDAP
ncbi:hypothetical protein BU202_01555 [Streptococcus cuniculi]|uniref:Uncharacterized protein n=1 Tax=Streptococcus cuniculi TaxID=1432788 RepID=A0A1Q8EB41_9STRE|nr:hypothetical protein [Streptococcus cuniculi]OLF48995.1 hypothetical protein BU202_01555 [Streptococcus cuniculi]